MPWPQFPQWLISYMTGVRLSEVGNERRMSPLTKFYADIIRFSPNVLFLFWVLTLDTIHGTYIFFISNWLEGAWVVQSGKCQLLVSAPVMISGP